LPAVVVLIRARKVLAVTLCRLHESLKSFHFIKASANKLYTSIVYSYFDLESVDTIISKKGAGQISENSLRQKPTRSIYIYRQDQQKHRLIVTVLAQIA
jgi:hypothetical protein